MESRILEHSVNHVKMRHKCISVVPVLVSNYSSSSSSRTLSLLFIFPVLVLEPNCSVFIVLVLDPLI